MLIYIYCLFVKLEEKKWKVKDVWKLFKYSLGFCRQAAKSLLLQQEMHKEAIIFLSFFFFLLYRLSCLALWIGMTQTTLEAITICPLFCKIRFCLHSSKLFKAKGTLASCTGEELRYRHTLHLEGSFSTFFSGTKSRILQRKISL